MKKILSVLLALTMSLSLTTMAWADGDGSESNPYTLEQFNALTDVAGKEVWVNIGDIDLSVDASKSATVGNYQMSDEYCWVSDDAAAPEGFTATTRRNAQDTATAYRTNKAGATIHVKGSFKTAKYTSSNFSGFQTLCFQLPEQSTVILEGMTLGGSFNLSGCYVYMYNLPDGSIGHLQNPVPAGYTNVWYDTPFVVNTIKLSGCTVNGQWFANGGPIARNVVIDDTTFNEHRNAEDNWDWSNPIWWKTQTGMNSLTINNCEVTSTRPMKVGEGGIGAVTVTQTTFNMLPGDHYTNVASDATKNSALALYDKVNGNVTISGNKLNVETGHTQLLALDNVTMAAGARIKLEGNVNGSDTALTGRNLVSSWKDDDNKVAEIDRFVEDNVDITLPQPPTPTPVDPAPVDPTPEPTRPVRPEHPARRYPTGTTTATGTETAGTDITSAKTFDAGIALYIGMSALSLSGSALLLGKKKEF